MLLQQPLQQHSNLHQKKKQLTPKNVEKKQLEAMQDFPKLIVMFMSIIFYLLLMRNFYFHDAEKISLKSDKRFLRKKNCQGFRILQRVTVLRESVKLFVVFSLYLYSEIVF